MATIAVAYLLLFDGASALFRDLAYSGRRADENRALPSFNMVPFELGSGH
jgi:hypothetical protein